MAADEPDVAAAKEVPFVHAHLVGWQRPSDFGVIAEIDGAAAWTRHIPAEDNPVHIDEHSPGVTIAVRDGVRGKGIGETLRALLDEAAARNARLSLDVRETNSAMPLYEPVGFPRVRGRDVRNRVGTMSFSMVHGEDSAGR
jgi:GNAT superfamily N-acetyltransferase